MSDWFYHFGRHFGRAAVPWLRKSKWFWKSVTGDEAEAIQAETEFGQVLALEIRRRFGGGDTASDSTWVSDVGRRLRAGVENPLRKFRVEVLDMGEANAMALPGGFLFVGVQLLDLCQRQPDEVAFVIGHEMAHVLRGHTLHRIVSQVGFDVVSAVLTRGRLSPWLRQSGMKLLRTAHSRQQELEADAEGVRLAHAAGYDPLGAWRLFKRLRRLRECDPQLLGEYFSSHPSETTRMSHLKTCWSA